MMHADRTNRVVLALFGLVLAAAGAGALLAGADLLGDGLPSSSLLDNSSAAYIGRNGDWFWPVLAVAALILALLAIWWLSKIIASTNRIGHIDLPARPPAAAHTSLVAGALTEAVAREIEGYRGVGSVRVALVGPVEAPMLAMAVNASRGADLAALRDRIETGALANARRVLENPHLPATVDIGLLRREAPRVA
jgi:hypothetical protein